MIRDLQTIHQAIARMHEAGATILSMPDLAKELKVGLPRWFRRLHLRPAHRPVPHINILWTSA